MFSFCLIVEFEQKVNHLNLVFTYSPITIKIKIIIKNLYGSATR